MFAPWQIFQRLRYLEKLADNLGTRVCVLEQARHDRAIFRTSDFRPDPLAVAQHVGSKVDALASALGYTYEKSKVQEHHYVRKGEPERGW